MSGRDSQRDLSQAGKSVRGIVVSIRWKETGRMSASSGVETPISSLPNSNARRAKIF